MLPKLTHIATVLVNLKAKQIKEIEKTLYNYISPKNGAAIADLKTIHDPTASGRLGLHYFKEFLQALKVSWIKRLDISRSFLLKILDSLTNININILQETDNPTMEKI